MLPTERGISKQHRGIPVQTPASEGAADLGRKWDTIGARIFMFRLGRFWVGNPGVAAKESISSPVPLSLPCWWSEGSCAASDCKAVQAVS